MEESEIPEELNSGSECQNSEPIMASRTRGARASKKSSAKKEATDKRFEALENKFNDKLDTMMNFIRESIQTLSNNVFTNADESNEAHDDSVPMCRDTGGVATRRPVLRQTNNDDSEGMRPIIPLESDVRIERTVSVPTLDDQISLAPSTREVRELLGDDEVSLSDDFERNFLLESDQNQMRIDSNNNRFQNLLNKNTDSNQTKTSLNDIFGNVSSTAEEKIGLCLDKAQEEILMKSWRSSDPEKLTAYRDEYRQCFPVHKDSSDFLQVPSLDDILEPMLRKKHGSKANKGWGKNRNLVTQPLKSIETLAYQGQIAARMGIIAIAYMQQALGTLLNSISSQDVDTVQSIKDIFCMSTKALDQMGRTGALHHLIRRKAAAQDTGLVTLKDIHSKIISLPLTNDGVFGKKLEEKLKERKEQKDSIKDLIPEWNERNQKRKFSETTSENSGTFKRPKTSVVHNRGQTFQRSNFNRRSYDYKQRDDNSRATSAATSVDRMNSFRIPKKTSK